MIFEVHANTKIKRIKVLLEITANGKSAGVAVSFISCPAVNEPFVSSKPAESQAESIWILLWI